MQSKVKTLHKEQIFLIKIVYLSLVFNGIEHIGQIPSPLQKHGIRKGHDYTRDLAPGQSVYLACARPRTQNPVMQKQGWDL